MIKDSGTRRDFPSGAVRDIQEGKGRCDLMPLDVIFAILDDDYIFHYLHCFQNDGNVCHLFVVLHHFCDSAYDHLTSTMLLEVAKHFEAGAQKYGEWNWQKGIPVKCYIDSAVRHYLKWLRGDNDEPHDRAFVWNILCCIWTCKHKPELNDYSVPAEKHIKSKELCASCDYNTACCPAHDGIRFCLDCPCRRGDDCYCSIIEDGDECKHYKPFEEADLH